MCDILKNKIKKYIDSVVYTVKPKIDRYIGKIHKMESNSQRHDASENLQTLPQMIKNKSALPAGKPMAANRKTAANSSTSTIISTSTNSTTTSNPDSLCGNESIRR